MLIEYTRKKGKEIEFVDEKTGEKKTKFLKGKPFGCLVAILQEDTISIGWSLCSSRDEWDRDVAQNIAWARATVCEDHRGRGVVMSVPQSIAEQFEAFAWRSAKYFQTDNFTCDYGFEYSIAVDDVMSLKAFKFIV